MLIVCRRGARNDRHDVNILLGEPIRNAAAETALPLATFPEDCPFAVDQILTEEWLP